VKRKREKEYTIATETLKVHKSLLIRLSSSIVIPNCP
jgi:hypothetical protein